MDKLLKELEKIIEIEGINPIDGIKARKQALKEFIDSHIQEVSVENSLIKTNLTSEEEDFLKYHIGWQIAEKIIEDSAMVVSSGNKIKVSVLVMGNSFPRNK